MDVKRYDCDECEAMVADCDGEWVAFDDYDRLRAERDAWTETAAQYARNGAFYRGIVTQIGDGLGVAARTAGDGSVMEDVLALRVPELVAALRAERDALARRMRVIDLGIVPRMLYPSRRWLLAIADESFLDPRRDAISPALVAAFEREPHGWGCPADALDAAADALETAGLLPKESTDGK